MTYISVDLLGSDCEIVNAIRFWQHNRNLNVGASLKAAQTKILAGNCITL